VNRNPRRLASGPSGPAAVNGESMGKSCTSQLILSVGYLVSYLLAITALLAGDIIFTGTPRRVSLGRGHRHHPPGRDRRKLNRRQSVH
jgi:2-keto-4-pentenoate hydratase/2-oxohepta-3-ene-1,7-dioic acid hydratase in catechol pathway